MWRPDKVWNYLVLHLCIVALSEMITKLLEKDVLPYLRHLAFPLEKHNSEDPSLNVRQHLLYLEMFTVIDVAAQPCTLVSSMLAGLNNTEASLFI